MDTESSGIQAALLVRDANGKPRFDDVRGIPLVFWNALTEEEQEEIKRNGGYASNGNP